MPRWDSKCHCGNISFSGSTRDLHCCPGPQPCRLDPGTGDVVCPGAEATPLERPCSRGGELTCYNDYGLSEVLGRGARLVVKSLQTFVCSSSGRYLCEATRQCVRLLDMCHGVDWCATSLDRCPEHEHGQCGPGLRCIEDAGLGANLSYSTKSISTAVVRGHHYCRDATHINDGKYDAIDREDETDIKVVTEAATALDWAQFRQCRTSAAQGNNSGLTCGQVASASYCFRLFALSYILFDLSFQILSLI